MKDDTEIIVMTIEMSFDDIVSRILATIAKEPGAEESWRNIKYEDLIQCHMTVGMSIRNCYHLWDENHPLTIGANPQQHPDDVSMKIMQHVWSAVNSDNAISEMSTLKLPMLPDTLRNSFASLI